MSTHFPRSLRLATAAALLPVAAFAQDPFDQAPSSQGPQSQPAATTAARSWPSNSDEAGGVGGTALSAPTAAGSFVTPIHTAEDDPAGGSYGIWAAGDDYKVGFESDMTFIPYLGKKYPVTRSLSWRTIGATAGGQSLLVAGQPAKRWHDDFRYEYRFGALVEAYDVLPEGLEQTFVLAERPATPGDFTVQGRIQANLSGSLQANGTIRFADDQGRELIEYGAATVIDAAGKRLPLTTDFDGDVVTLRVPGSWMETAVFPVTIDPLIAPTNLQLGVAPAESIEVVRDDFGSNGLYNSYSRFVSATDADAWGRIYGDDWSPGGAGTLVYTDITTSWSSAKLQSSICGPEQTYVTAVSREFFSTNNQAIRIWAQPTSTTTVVTTVLFAPFTSGTVDSDPSVGGVPQYDESGAALTGSSCLIAYQRDLGAVPNTNSAESEIWGLLVDCSTSPATLGTPFEIGNTASNRDQEHPDVNDLSEGGATTTWIVAYQEYNNGIPGDDWDGIAKQVDSTGTATSTIWFPSVSTGNHKVDLKVAGQNGRYCVFYCRVEEPGGLTKISGYEGTHVDSERFDWPVGGSITKFPAQGLGTAFSGARYLRVYGLSHDSDTDSFWAGVWHATDILPIGSGNFFVDRVGFDGEGCEGNSILSGSIGYTDGGIIYDDDANQFVFAYGTDDAASTHPILGRAHEFPAQSPTFGTTGLACNSANILWDALDSDGTVIFANDQQIGHQFGRLRVSGGPPAGFHLLQLSADPVNVLIINPLITPGCRLLVDVIGPGYFGAVTAFGPSASWQIQLPPNLPEFTLHCQDWIYNLSTDLLTSSDRLSIPFEKN